MINAVYEVQFGKHAGKIITEQTTAGISAIKLRASAMGWRLIAWYVS